MRRVFRNEELEREFGRNGYVVVDLLDPSQTERLRAAWDALPADVHHYPFSNTIMSQDLNYRARVHDIVALELESRANDLLLDYRICLGSFIAKPGGAGAEQGFVELHQDWTFVDESRFYSIGIWCPLVDVDESNGCLCVVPQSHRLNRYARCLTTPFPYNDLLPSIEQNYLRSVPMKAGQAFVYTQTLFHSSAPNRTNTLRLAAGGLAIPHETSLMFVAPGEGDHALDLALFEVDDAFYRRYQFGSRPDSSPVGFLPHRYEPLTIEDLHHKLGITPHV